MTPRGVRNGRTNSGGVASQSQLSELRVRIQEDEATDHREFIDESYSRDDLVRPALDRLRDLVAERCFDRVYVQCPDQLATGAKLILLVEDAALR